MQKLKWSGVLAVHAVLLVGCTQAPTLLDLFRASDYQDPPGRGLAYVLKAPIVVLGVVTGAHAVGRPKPAREDPRLLVQLTRITIQTEMVIKGGLKVGSLSFYYYTFSRQNRLDLGIHYYVPTVGERRLFFLEQSNDIYRSVGDVTDYTLAVRSGLHDRAVCASESLGCCVAKLLMTPGQGYDSEAFALGLHYSVHVSNLLCSRAVTRQLLNNLDARSNDGTIIWRARELLRSEISDR